MRTEQPSFSDFNKGPISIVQGTLEIPSELIGDGKPVIDNYDKYYKLLFNHEHFASFAVSSIDGTLTTIQEIAQADFYNKLIAILRTSRAQLSTPISPHTIKGVILDFEGGQKVYDLYSLDEHFDYRRDVLSSRTFFAAIHIEDPENLSKERSVSVQKIPGVDSHAHLTLSQPRGAIWSRDILASILFKPQVSIVSLKNISRVLTKQASLPMNRKL